MWWDVLRTGSTLMLPGASQWRLQISACSAIGCLSVTSAMEISTLLTQLAVSSLEPYLILAVTRLKSMDSGRCRLAEAIPTQGRRTSCSLRLARTMNRMGCWASLVQSPPNSAETPNKQRSKSRPIRLFLSAHLRISSGTRDLRRNALLKCQSCPQSSLEFNHDVASIPTVTVPAAAEVPVRGLAIAQFANLCHHRSNRMRRSRARLLPPSSKQPK